MINLPVLRELFEPVIAYVLPLSFDHFFFVLVDGEARARPCLLYGALLHLAWDLVVPNQKAACSNHVRVKPCSIIHIGIFMHNQMRRLL